MRSFGPRRPILKPTSDNPGSLRNLNEDSLSGLVPLISASLVISVQAVLQSLVVLIENACEADTAGKPVTLDIRIHDGKEVYFRIYDNGPGIPEALRGRIGQPFFTTKANQSGMGLGIFLV